METMVLEVAIPKELFSILGFSKPLAAEAIREFLALGLYLDRRISVGKAAELLGIRNRKREFIRVLAHRRIPYFAYTDEELEEEFKTLDEWKRERTSAA